MRLTSGGGLVRADQEFKLSEQSQPDGNLF